MHLQKPQEMHTSWSAKSWSGFECGNGVTLREMLLPFSLQLLLQTEEIKLLSDSLFCHPMNEHVFFHASFLFFFVWGEEENHYQSCTAVLAMMFFARHSTARYQHFALAHRFFYRRSATLIVPNSVIWIDDLHLIEFNWRHEGEGKSIDAMKNWCAIGRELNEFSMNNWVYINFGWRERGRTHWSQSHTNYIIVIRNEQTPTCQLVYVSNECVWASDES